MHLTHEIQKKKKLYNPKIYCLIFFFVLLTFSIFWCIKKTTREIKINKNVITEQSQYKNIINDLTEKNADSLHKTEIFTVMHRNIYGTLTSFFLAKKYVLNNQLDKALTVLNNSLEYTSEENLKNILKIRIAKIKTQQNKHKEAIKILEEIHNRDWISIIENLKGDILMKNHQIKKAILAWEKSKKFEESNAFKEIIDLKIINAKQINAN